MNTAVAAVGGSVATELVDITDDLSCLDGDGRWFVAAMFEGPTLAFRFSQWRPGDVPAGAWRGPRAWTSATSRQDYVQAVEIARAHIASGDVYQVNVCRLLHAQWPAVGADDIAGLYQLLRRENPAPHSAMLSVDDPRLQKYGFDELRIASASPELFLRRQGDVVSSSPIKGTASLDGEFAEKDVSENIMIVDLVRNDLSAVCDVASIEVPHLLEHQAHPGLQHLVSTVQGRLRPDVGWQDVFATAFPPGSVTGAPKSSALRIISELESPRGVYCGALGFVDADSKTAELNVAIRTFWKDGDRLMFGTGAGITWGSDANAEWEETELKARHLTNVASGNWQA